jgi:hypothetical protein
LEFRAKNREPGRKTLTTGGDGGIIASCQPPFRGPEKFHLLGANLMKARLLSVACVAAGLMLVGAPSAKAEFVTEPISGFLFPGESIDAFFPEEFDTIHQKTLTFEGNIQNTSFTAPTTMEFWFDWVDPRFPGVVTSPAQTFFLNTVPTHNNFQFFSTTDGTALTYEIPFCPPAVSIHWRNLGPGGPVSVSGLFTYECKVPEPIALAILPLIVLMAPLAVRRMKALASA